MYKAILYQSGGCDYTIGCGVKVFELNASDMQDAEDKLEKIIEQEYQGEYKLSDCEILEVSTNHKVDLENVYENILQRKIEKDKELERQEDEREFQRLKKKLNYE